MSTSPAGSSVSASATVGQPKRSPVWEYFEYDDLQRKSVCQVLKPTSSDSDTSEICGHKLEGKFPTNLRQHLRKVHPDVFLEISKKDHEEEEKKKKEAERQKASLKVSQQLTLAQSLQSGRAYDKGNEKYKAITRKLAIFIGTTNVPNSIVENLALKDLLHTADPRYKVPSRTVISKELERVYIELRAKIGCYLQEAKKVSLTADIWSKKGLTSSYLGVTGHFFSWKDQRSHCVTLAVRRLESTHTAVNIRSAVEVVLLEWDIPHSKVSAIFTDNGSNIVAAFRARTAVVSDDEADDDDDSGDEEEEADEDDETDFDVRERDHEITFSAFRRVSCFAHTLQLVVLQFDQATTFRDALRCSHRLVSKVNSSTKATEKLIGVCGKKLIRSCPTRWSSTFLMIERLLLVKDGLGVVLEEMGWDNLPTSVWRTLVSIKALLQPFAQFTNLVSGEDFITLSSVVPAIMDLNLHLEEVSIFITC